MIQVIYALGEVVTDESGALLIKKQLNIQDKQLRSNFAI